MFDWKYHKSDKVSKCMNEWMNVWMNEIVMRIKRVDELNENVEYEKVNENEERSRGSRGRRSSSKIKNRELD